MSLATQRAQRVAGFAVCLLLVGMLGCAAVAGWFDHRKHALSGVPTNHYAVNEDGRRFYVHQGSPPLDERPQFSLTAEQHRAWEENDQGSQLWGTRAVLCFFGAAGIVLVWKAFGPPDGSDAN
jgi:hypothetical protein